MTDPFYGHKDLACLSELVITQLFASPNSTFSSSSSIKSSKHRSGASTPSRSEKPVPRLAEFIAYALYRTRLPEPILFSALLLLHRLKTLYPTARGTPTSPHRLFLSSLMLSAKICCDDTYSNASWKIVANGGGLGWELKEINQMERELFGFLKWDVVVHKEDLEDWEEECRQAWEEQCRHDQETALGNVVEEDEDEDEDDEIWINVSKFGSRDKLAKEAAMSLLKNHHPTRHSYSSNSSSSCSSGFSTPSRRHRPYPIPPPRRSLWATNNSVSSDDDSPNLSDSSTNSSSFSSPQGPRTPEFNLDATLESFSKSNPPPPALLSRMDIFV